MREFVIHLGAISTVALSSAAFTLWLGLESGWKVAIPVALLLVFLLAAAAYLSWTLKRTQRRLHAVVGFSKSIFVQFSTSLHAIRCELDAVEDNLKSGTGSFATDKQSHVHKKFQEPLSMLISVISQLLPAKHNRSVLGAYLKRPVGDDEVEILVADLQTSRIYNLEKGRRHANSPARRKLEGGSAFEPWYEHEMVNPFDPSAREGLVAGSLLKRELLCITSNESGVVAGMIRDHEDLLRELLPLACSRLFREFDRYEQLCRINDGAIPYARKPGDDKLVSAEN